MIYIKAFKNYEEFKELFGVNEHGNGEKSRRNKILLSVFKSKTLLHLLASQKETYYLEDLWNGNNVYYERWQCQLEESYTKELFATRTMSDLFQNVLNILSYVSREMDDGNYINIPFIQGIFSKKYESDDFRGLCEDGDIRSVRYVNCENDRVFKMRAGKFLRKIIEEFPSVDSLLPEQVKIWLCEEFSEKWKAYAMQSLNADEYTLFVNDDFCRIYDSYECVGDFGSCMTDKDYWTFYRDSVAAKAAYLENEDGKIVARCIIYTDVIDGNGKHLRLAERQYSTDCSDTLKRLLVLRLIEKGEIDGYKRVGADCHSPNSFVDVHGNPLKNLDLKIRCNLEDYDVVSYQDSFKDYEDCWAYNTDSKDNLSVTGGELERDSDSYCWSSYNQEDIPEEDAYYVESRDDYFYGHQTVEAHCNGADSRFERFFEGDCLEIDGEYYYAGEVSDDYTSYGIGYCDWCGNYYLVDDEHYSELTGGYYCCDECMREDEKAYKKRNGWVYSEWDEDYIENKDNVVTIFKWQKKDEYVNNDYGIFYWRSNHYRPITISVDSLQNLIDEEAVVWMNGTYYYDDLGFDGEPAHYCAADHSLHREVA